MYEGNDDYSQNIYFALNITFILHECPEYSFDTNFVISKTLKISLGRQPLFFPIFLAVYGYHVGRTLHLLRLSTNRSR